MLSELPFAARYTYSPRGQSEVSVKSRRIRDWLKAAVEPAIAKMAERVRIDVENDEYPGFFGPNVVLVPVPGSTPRKDASTLWVGERLCEALLAEGIAGTAAQYLIRDYPVPKSAYQARGNRPTVKTHYDSLSVAKDLLQPERILLVDDIVTRGSTLLACGSRIQEAFPNADVRAFAMLRTMGLIPDVLRTADPVVGSITAIPNNGAHRDP